MTFIANALPRITVVTVQRRPTKGAVIFKRNGPAEVELDDRGPLSQQIVTQRDGQQVRRPLSKYVFVRNRLVPPTETPAAPAVRSHVIGLPRRKQPSTQVAKSRAPDLPAVFAAPVVRSHVIGLPRRRQPPTTVQHAHGPLTDPVALGESRIDVIHARKHARHPAREPTWVFLRTPTPIVQGFIRASSRIHVVTPFKLKRPESHVVQLRNPGRAAIGKSGRTVIHGRAKAQHPSRDAKVVQLRAPVIAAPVFAAPVVRSHVIQAQIRPPQTRVTTLRAPTIVAQVAIGESRIDVIPGKRDRVYSPRGGQAIYIHPALGFEPPVVPGTGPTEPPAYGKVPGGQRGGRRRVIEPHVKLEKEQAKKPEEKKRRSVKPKPTPPPAPTEIYRAPPETIRVESEQLPPVAPVALPAPGAIFAEPLVGVEDVMAALREEDELVWLLIAAATLS